MLMNLFCRFVANELVSQVHVLMNLFRRLMEQEIMLARSGGREQSTSILELLTTKSEPQRGGSLAPKTRWILSFH